MQLILPLAYASFFIFLIGKLKFYSFDDISKRWVQFFFVVKLVSGFLLSLIYTYYYTNRLTADTFKYFDDSKIIFDLFFKDTQLFFQFMFGAEQFTSQYLDVSNQMNTWWNKFTIYNDARTMIRFNVMLRFISLGHYHVHAVIFNFIAFTGLVALAKVLVSEIKDLKKEFIFLLFLFPSLTFWSSGLMKDGIIFFSLGFGLLYLKKYFTGRKTIHAFIAGLFAVLLFFTKLHIFFIYIPCGLALLLCLKYNSNIKSYFVFAATAMLVLALLTNYLIHENTIPALLAEKQNENILIAKDVQAGSYIEINRLDGTWISIIKNMPAGFINTLIRPHLFDSFSPFILLSALENILLLLLMILAIVSSTKFKLRLTPLFCFAILFVFLLFTMIGMMTPVLGALVRYKIQGLPFLLFIIFSIADKEKLIRRFTFIKPLLQND